MTRMHYKEGIIYPKFRIFFFLCSSFAVLTICDKLHSYIYQNILKSAYKYK